MRRLVLDRYKEKPPRPEPEAPVLVGMDTGTGPDTTVQWQGSNDGVNWVNYDFPTLTPGPSQNASNMVEGEMMSVPTPEEHRWVDGGEIRYYYTANLSLRFVLPRKAIAMWYNDALRGWFMLYDFRTDLPWVKGWPPMRFRGGTICMRDFVMLRGDTLTLCIDVNTLDLTPFGNRIPTVFMELEPA